MSGYISASADYAVQSQDAALSEFLRDAIAFVESAREAIEFSAAHIYLSALPYSPRESLVVQTFSARLAGLATVSVLGVASHYSRKVNALAISLCLDGSSVASASSDHCIRAWDADTYEEISAVTLDQTREFLTVAISTHGLIATGCADRTVRLWDPAEPNFVMPSLRGHTSGVKAVAFSPDGTQLVSGSDDTTIRIWEVKPSQLMIKTITTSASISSVAFSPDGHLIAAGDASGILRLYDAELCNMTLTFNCGRDIRSVAFALDEKHVLAACGSNIVGVDRQNGSQVFTLTGHTSRINAIACSQDPTSDTGEEFVSAEERFFPSEYRTRSVPFVDERLIVSAANDATIRIWDAKTGERRGPVLRGHIGAVLAVGVSPDGRSIVSAGVDGTARVWNLERVRSLGEQPLQRSVLAKSREVDGWMVSPSNQRLMWVPPEYRGRVEVSGQSQIIATHWKHAVLDGDDAQLHHGDQWTSCWDVAGI